MVREARVGLVGKQIYLKRIFETLHNNSVDINMEVLLYAK